MQASLRNRLTWGPIMLAGLLALLYGDWRIEQATRGVVKVPGEPHESHGLAGVGLFVLLMLLLPVAIREMASLLTAKNVRPYRIIAGLGSGLLMMHAFFTQFVWFQHIAASTLMFIVVFVMILAALRR